MKTVSEECVHTLVHCGRSSLRSVLVIWMVTVVVLGGLVVIGCIVFVVLFVLISQVRPSNTQTATQEPFVLTPISVLGTTMAHSVLDISCIE